MKVTFDKDGYVEMLIKKGDLPNSIELEDDDSLDMSYITCYKLGFEGTKLVLDADKVQRIKSNEKALDLIFKLKKQLSETDYKVLRHIRENALKITPSMTEEQYLILEAQRESLTRQIREIQDGTNLETDVNAILQEGYLNRIKEIQEDVSVKEEVVEEPKKTTKKKTTKKKDSEE